MTSEESDSYQNPIGMDEKRKISDRAKSLIETQPDEALALYKQLFSDYRASFNAWDTFFALKASKSAKNPDISFASDIIQEFKDDRTGSMYGWVVYQHCVKGKTEPQIKTHTAVIEHLLSLGLQKDSRVEPEFPCPVSLSVIALAEAYKVGIGNTHKTIELLEKLDRHKLSIQSSELTGSDGKRIKFLSEYEKYIALLSDSYLKANKFNQCIEVCNEALQIIDQFHYDNEVWFKKRIAESLYGIGEKEQSKKKYEELISSKTGAEKWFLFKSLAEIYLIAKEYGKAWEYSIDAAWLGNEPGYMLGLYQLQTRVLTMLNRVEEAKKHAQLIAAVIQKEKKTAHPPILKLLDYFEISLNKAYPFNDALKAARAIWEEYRYKGLEPEEGVVLKLKPSGKKGLIKTKKGETIGFRLKDVLGRVESPDRLIHANVRFYLIENKAGIKSAEKITLKHPSAETTDSIRVGEILTGKIKAIKPFGIFVAMEGKPDGLIHISQLPESTKEDLEKTYRLHDRFEVKVIRITQKGVNLALVEEK